MIEQTIMGELHHGDYGCFDPLYGPERVQEATPSILRPSGIECVHLHLTGADPGAHRFVVRGANEPVLRVDFHASAVDD
jgi:hypothetical protein